MGRERYIVAVVINKITGGTQAEAGKLSISSGLRIETTDGHR
jgi:hypothetical protein